MKKINKLGILLVVLVLTTMSIFAGCQNAEESTGNANGNNGEDSEVTTKLDEIKEAGKIVLGTAADYPPYEFHKEIDGKDSIVGFDIEIANEIAEDIGVELEIKDMKFEGLLAALQTGKIDFIIAGMVPTAERAENVDFSKIYYNADQSFLTKSGKGSEYKTIEDLAGLTVGAQKATTQADIAKDKIDSGEVKLLAKITDLVLALKNDKVDGVVLVKPVAEAYAKANDDLEVAEVSLGKEDGVSIAVGKGNSALLESVNNTIDKLLEENKIDKFIKDATKLSEEN
ncbi:transporter substrate-binding domain-containing protein [Clostridiisalibacter paucivorans]|uniref:transporter substrate-binding domain-containing protein n=1 Tax=Clostridiisalibacter paucivorans TaxID=408753 RepID=UPI00047ACBFC|nr:transporter substrate-binding domain-containing protein [Clostridiisalibacter paucivorans]